MHLTLNLMAVTWNLFRGVLEYARHRLYCSCDFMSLVSDPVFDEPYGVD